MPTLNWIKKDLETDSKSKERVYFCNPQVLEINHNPIIDGFDFETIQNNRNNLSSLSNLHDSQNWDNLLFWGDNLDVMQYLLKDFANAIDLIYIDPPFATGNSFYYKILIGEDNSSEISEAYSDSWTGGINEYLSFLYDRLKLMKQLLSETGSIYVHLDWHISHYIKVMMDELFGKEKFRNEIIWAYPAASVKTRRFFIRSYDSILFYTKTDNYTFNDDPKIYMEYSNRVKDNLKKDDHGTFYYRGGSHGGIKLSQKVYIKEDGIFPRDVWNDIPYIRANTLEYQGFSTQKPERLLKRIILASSNPGDIVADFFCGTGTSLTVAEKLQRNWIGSDCMKNAVDISKKRILSIYDSNDLFHWKKKYNKKPNSFKILALKNGFLYFKVPIQFLAVDKISEKIIYNSETEFQVSLILKDRVIKIQLKEYVLSNKIATIKDLVKNLKDPFDIIDAWAVDYNFNNESFNTSWISFRTQNKRKISFQSKPYFYKELGEYQVAVKVINIFGGESIQSYKVIVD